MPAILRAKAAISLPGLFGCARAAQPSKIGEDVRYSEARDCSNAGHPRRPLGASVEWPFCVRNVTYAGGGEG
jgi:hypothetical protein